MPDTSVTKVDVARSPNGPQEQRCLAISRALSMRLCHREPPGDGGTVQREDETIGYVISGRAELNLGGQTVILQAGTSWVVPKGAEHSDHVQEAFTAVQVMQLPAEVHDRDAVQTAYPCLLPRPQAG